MKKIKNFLKENWKLLSFYFILFIILTFPVPYYIETPGGLIDVGSRIKIENQDKIQGSFYLSYVATLDGNVMNYLLSYAKKDWERVKKEEFVIEDESVKAANKRSQMMLSDANQIALYVAYKKANQEIKIKDSRIYVYYLTKEAKTELEVGDQILKINDQNITDLEQLADYIKTLNPDQEIVFTILRDNKEKKVSTSFIKYENEMKLGIAFHHYIEVETNPKVTFHFKQQESGPSGGLMMTLAIYNQLVDDITNGLKVAGTGTIEINGEVGAIDGVKFKLMGAVKDKADVFFVPVDNYAEALKVKKEKGYKIELVAVKTFDEAVEYLKWKS